MKKILKKIVVAILTFETRLVLKKYKPKVVAITGNVGKTTTKEAVGLVLSKFVDVRISQKSFNSEIGVPLTVLGLENAWSNPVDWFINIIKGFLLIVLPRKFPKWLVLEIGAGKPGDIKDIASWLTIDALIVTRFPDVPVHIEFFKSRDHLISEKSYLVHSLRADGVMILNHDDADVLSLKSGVSNKVMTYGMNPSASIGASNISLWFADTRDFIPSGLQFKANYEGNSIPLFMSKAVSHIHVYAALSALAVARHFDFDMLEAASVFTGWNGLPGRLSLIEGIKKTILIDDTYNASPTATEAALDVLGKFEINKRKIAVLGDMLELGKHTKDAHVAIGKYAFKKCTILVTVGKRAEFFREGALLAGFIPEHIFSFATAHEAGTFVQNAIESGDIILFKGSQGVRLERTVEMVMARPEEKKHLLARQDKEWEKK